MIGPGLGLSSDASGHVQFGLPVYEFIAASKLHISSHLNRYYLSDYDYQLLYMFKYFQGTSLFALW
jgi:hypothetical protein